MTAPGRWKVLPHEVLCAAFFAVMWARLVSVVGFLARDSLIFLAVMVLQAAVVGWCMKRETDRRWRVRLLFYAVAMNALYPVLRTAIPSVHPRLEDEALQAADRWLVGGNLSLRMQFIVHPALTEALSFCYLLYFFYLLFSQAWYLFRDLPTLKKYYMGLFSLYAIGYFGYSMLPAWGPYLVMSDRFAVPLEGGWFTSANDRVVRAGSNRVDVFPSLHCANSLYVLLFDRAHKRWRFWLYLVPCAGFWVSTLYLRYHYFVDLVVGLLLSVTTYWMVQRRGDPGPAAGAEGKA